MADLSQTSQSSYFNNVDNLSYDIFHSLICMTTATLMSICPTGGGLRLIWGILGECKVLHQRRIFRLGVRDTVSRSGNDVI